MALSKKDLQINITLNELYNTHQLLTQHMDVLVSRVSLFVSCNVVNPFFMQSPNDRHHLRVLLDELGPAHLQVPRNQNKAIDLTLYSRWETPIQDITTALMAENDLTQNDILYMETKAIFVQLIRSIPQLADNKKGINLPSIADRAATAKDSTLVRKGLKVKEMLRELEEANVMSKDDDYKLMREEVAAELVHLGNMREKAVLETSSLEAVYKTIGDHNNYLRSQLEQYKAYLQNVREIGSKDAKGNTGVGVLAVNGKEKKPSKQTTLGPYRFTHVQFEKEGIIMESNVPDNR
jgi:Ras GTPase-activating-like protein IQGAP2/3